jgi:phage gp46-like protein
MSDLYLKPTEFGGEVEYDSRNDFVLTDGLFTACYISLFSEPYWGNSIMPTEARLVSQLTQLFERPISSSTRNIAIRTTERALNWLIENEIASEIQVDCEIQNVSSIYIVVRILEPDENIQEFGYKLNWRGNFIESERRNSLG